MKNEGSTNGTRKSKHSLTKPAPVGQNVNSKKENRALLQNLKIKKAIQYCSTESGDAVNKKATTKSVWDEKFSKYSSLEEEEEWADIFGDTHEWEQSEFIQSWDNACIDESLLNDSDISDDGNLKVIDVKDDLELSVYKPHGKDLAKYTSLYSQKLQASVAETKVKQGNVKIHISGSMKASLKHGNFSDFRSKTKIRVYDMELTFNEEYLNMMMLLTGHDLKKCAYEINMLTDSKGTKTTFNQMEPSSSKPLQKLNDSSLVNMSITSELNRSRHAKRILSMVTPIRIKQEKLDRTVTSELDRSRHTRWLVNMVTPIRIKQERLDSTVNSTMTANPSSILNITPTQMKQETVQEVTPLKIKQERREVKSEPSTGRKSLRSTVLSNSLNNPESSRYGLRSRTWREYANEQQTDEEVTLKRNCDTDSLYSASPSKRHRFADESILSSTRVDETRSFNTSQHNSSSSHFKFVLNGVTPIKRQIKEGNLLHNDIPPPHRLHSDTCTAPTAVGSVKGPKLHKSYSSSNIPGESSRTRSPDYDPCCQRYQSQYQTSDYQQPGLRPGPTHHGHRGPDYSHLPHYPVSHHQARSYERQQLKDTCYQRPWSDYKVDHSQLHDREANYRHDDCYHSYDRGSSYRSQQCQELEYHRPYYRNSNFEQLSYNRHMVHHSTHGSHMVQGNFQRNHHDAEYYRHKLSHQEARILELDMENQCRQVHYQLQPGIVHYQPGTTYYQPGTCRDQENHTDNVSRTSITEVIHCQADIEKQSRTPLSPIKPKTKQSNQKNISARKQPKSKIIETIELSDEADSGKSKQPKNIVAKMKPAAVGGSAEYIPIVSDLLKGLNHQGRTLRIKMNYDVQLASDEDKDNSNNSSDFSNSIGDKNTGFNDSIGDKNTGFNDSIDL